MKKIFTILCIGLFTIGTTSAQSGFTLTGGINLANVVSDDYEPDMKVGFRIGGVGSLPLSDYVSLRGGVLYSTKGCVIPDQVELYDTFGNFIGYTDLTINLSYIEAPFGIEFSANDMISFHAGIYSAFLVGDKSEAGGISGSADAESVDMGLDFGATFSVNDALSINAGYQYGFTEVFENSEAYNRSIVIAMGYTFGGY
tara:strand:+ start:1042 stop:1638 length:597 start_codon:yes stop_codon:yes gene_type:complete